MLLLLTKTRPEWFGEISFWDIVWPSAIIFAGLSGCVSRDVSGFSLGITAVGVLFLLKNLGVIEGSVWPIAIAIVLILVGVTTILHQLIRRRRRSCSGVKFTDGKSGKFRSEYSDMDGVISYNASFGEDHIIPNASRISGGKANVSFGDFTLDLRSVREFADDAALEVNVSFGDAEILLPKTVRVTVESAGAFSGKGVTGTPDPDAPYTLRVKAAVSFGNLSIKYD